MFCTKCGKELPDDSKFCIYCGTPITQQKAAAAETVKKQTAAAGTPVKKEPKNYSSGFQNDQKSFDFSKLLHNKIFLICCAVGVVIIAAIAVVSNMSSKIDALAGVEPVFTGINGYGYASIDTYPAENNAAYNKLKQRIADTYNDLLMGDKNYESKYKKVEKESAFLNSLSCQWVFAENQQNGKLNNGDKIAYECSYDEDAGAAIKYKYTDLSKEYTVNGLADGTEIDLFEGVEPAWNLESGYPELKLNKPEDSSIANLGIDYNYSANDIDAAGNILVTANVSEEYLAEQGYTVKDGLLQKEYYVGRKPIQVTDLSPQEVQDAIKYATDEQMNNLLGQCGWQLYVGGNPADVSQSVFEKIDSSWSTAYARYNVTVSDKTYKRDIEVYVWRMADNSLQVILKSNNAVGCTVSSSSSYWYGN